jgi:maltokinase
VNGTMVDRDAAAGLLSHWLPGQRWFGGKGEPVESVTVVAETPLRAGDPSLDHLVIEVQQASGTSRYQLLVGARAALPSRLEHAVIGRVDNSRLYDAAHDSELTAELLTLLAEDRSVGPLRFARLAESLDTGLPSLVVGTEQSNTSMIYGERYILKLFRRLAPGTNPDLEVTRALAERHCRYVIPPLGDIETDLDGQPTTLAMLQPYLRSATDGWLLAETSVRDLYAEGDLHADEVGGDFAGEADRLGVATAEVHQLLAEALPSRMVGRPDAAATARQMHDRLDAALAVVPALAGYEPGLRLAYDELAEVRGPTLVQRIHGDFHLGQTMRTEGGWVLFDFEGEPARPLAERVALMSPLRDVAGMLRSFDYAARHLLADQPASPHLAYRAAEWAERNRAAFCGGYARGGGIDPRENQVLLRSFELDKAVYEVVYEARNRPSWLPIPLGAVERLVG